MEWVQAIATIAMGLKTIAIKKKPPANFKSALFGFAPVKLIKGKKQVYVKLAP